MALLRGCAPAASRGGGCSSGHHTRVDTSLLPRRARSVVLLVVRAQRRQRARDRPSFADCPALQSLPARLTEVDPFSYRARLVVAQDRGQLLGERAAGWAVRYRASSAARGPTAYRGHRNDLSVV